MKEKTICNDAVLIRCPAEMREAVERAAGGRGKVAAFIREAIAAYLADRGDAPSAGPMSANESLPRDQAQAA
jgi:predicted DNA-binding protein